MKKLSVVCIILAAVSMLISGFAVYSCFFREQPVTVVSPDDPAPQVKLTVEHLYEIIEPCEKLVTASDRYANKSSVSDVAHLWGYEVPLTTDRINFSYTGSILFGVDLSDIDLDINEESQSIYVVLPAPAVMSHSIDTSSFIFSTECDGFITEITPDEFVAKANQLKAEQEQKVAQDGKAYDEAKASAETAITSLITAAPEARGYELRFFYT